MTWILQIEESHGCHLQQQRVAALYVSPLCYYSCCFYIALVDTLYTLILCTF